MKREHKYRAWDKKGKKMMYSGFLICPTSPSWSPYIDRSNRDVEKLIDGYLRKNGDSFGSGGCWIAEGGDYYGDNLELLEWTGLKDKNGKDIYEGDIMICYHNDYYDDGSDRFVTVIEFMDGSFWSINEDCCSPEDCEVIGNVYENPELLQTA